MHFSFNFQPLNVYVRPGAVKSIDRRDRLMIEIEIEHNRHERGCKKKKLADGAKGIVQTLKHLTILDL